MLHYAKESGEEQPLGTNDLKFSKISAASLRTVETLAGSRCVV